MIGILIDPNNDSFRRVEFPADEKSIFRDAARLIGCKILDSRNLVNKNTVVFLEDQRYCLSPLCCLIKGGRNQFYFGKVIILNFDDTLDDPITQAFQIGDLDQIVEFLPSELCAAIKVELKVGIMNDYFVN